MAWGGFAIALLLVYLVQVALAALLRLPALDLFLVLALLCGLLCPTYDARLAAWVTGLAQDVGSADALGVHAFALGLTGLLLTHLREYGNVGVWWIAGLMALAAAWPGQVIYLLHLHYLSGPGLVSFWQLLLAATLTSALGAAIATLINALPWAAHHRRRRQRAFRI